MNRKSTAVIFLGILLFSASSLFGQANEIELTRAVIQTQRQAIVAENMELSEDEAQGFWPLYRQYRSEVSLVGDRLLKVVMTFADNYPELPEDTAVWMIDEFLAIEKAEAELKASWAPRFREVLSARQLARFFQIENKLDAIVQFDLAANIPLIE
jgi:hypothetical protein